MQTAAETAPVGATDPLSQGVTEVAEQTKGAAAALMEGDVGPLFTLGSEYIAPAVGVLLGLIVAYFVAKFVSRIVAHRSANAWTRRWVDLSPRWSFTRSWSAPCWQSPVRLASTSPALPPCWVPPDSRSAWPSKERSATFPPA